MRVAGAEFVISQFNYPGSVLLVDSSVDEEVNQRINKALASFGRIRKKVIHNYDLRLAIKVAVYRAVCLSVLL